MDTCDDCSDELVPLADWMRLTLPERRLARQRGKARKAGRGLCERCYMNRRNRGTLIDAPRTTVPREHVLDEWRHLVDRERTAKENAAAIAPRLGMTPDALLKALSRAGVA